MNWSDLQEPEVYSPFFSDVLQVAERISEFPKPGRIVPELNNQAIREIIPGNYRLVYRLKDRIAEMLTVHHGARLLDASKLR